MDLLPTLLCVLLPTVLTQAPARVHFHRLSRTPQRRTFPASKLACRRRRACWNKCGAFDVGSGELSTEGGQSPRLECIDSRFRAAYYLSRLSGRKAGEVS